jgi:hypothetical protein
MIESNHFRYEVMPAGRWSRLTGTTARGGSNEPRPHLIPTSDMARKLVEIDTTGFFGRTRLCPGEITLGDGSKTLGYRFIKLPEAEAASLMDQLDQAVIELQKAARD